MRVDEKGWLQREPADGPITHLPTVRISRQAPGGPVGLVWHATGGVGGLRYAEGLARRIQTYRRGVDRAASWHVCIAASGAVFQSAPFTVATWHVGRPGIIDGVQHPSINAVTIGVELENAGPLVRVQGGFYAWPHWLNRQAGKPDPRYRVDAERAVSSGKHAYDDFPERQLASARALVRAVAAYRDWGPDACRHCHADFAAPTKTDPGPIWTGLLPGLLQSAFEGKDRQRYRERRHSHGSGGADRLPCLDCGLALPAAGCPDRRRTDPRCHVPP
jgi:N-acetyl-anhydromuramyl-L-alanine amidase AmpD